MEAVVLTYEMLFECLRHEKSSAELRQLQSTFYRDYVAYVKEKQSMMKSDSSLFGKEESEKIQRQISNALRIMKELYERRERKILDLALSKCKAPSIVVSFEGMIEDEKKLYHEILNVLEANRAKVLQPLLDGREPVKDDIKEEGVCVVRLLAPIPKFLGGDMNALGPFEEDEMTLLPREIGEILKSKGKAEEVVFSV